MVAPVDASVLEQRSTLVDSTHNEWVLSVPLNDPGAAFLRAGSFAERGPLRVFVAGLIYEQEELAEALGVRHTASTSELILEACERWGETSTVRRLRGQFVVTVIDFDKQSVVVARDPLGMHPLFYARVGSWIHFSCEPIFLFKHAKVDRTLNRLALADHLCMRWPQQDETFFEHVKRVRPGWQAVVARGEFQLQRHWDPAPDDGAAPWLTEDEVSQFDERIDQAVNRALRLGRSGIFLSGGLDSISIAAVAAEETRRTGQPTPVGLSLAFPALECDERAVQSAVASRLGLPFRLFEFDAAVGTRGLLAQAVELNAKLSSPIINTWGPAYLTLTRAASADGIKVIMTGHGGDEWLTVSPFLAADLIGRFDIAGVYRFMRMWRRSYSHSVPRMMHSVLWRFGLHPLGSRLFYRMAPSAWDRARTRRAMNAQPPFVGTDPDLRAAQRGRVTASLAAADPAGGFYRRELRNSLDLSLVSWEMEEQHQYAGFAGVTFAHPYWDPDLIQMLYRTRPEHLMRGGRSKGLVRGTIARRFPGLGFDRQRKIAATSFYRALLRKEGPSLARKVGPLECLARLGVIGRGFSDIALRSNYDKTGKAPFLMWHLMNLETWARTYVN